MYEYGITTSETDYYAHVCPKDWALYVYRRQLMLETYKQYPRKELTTAIGYTVPCSLWFIRPVHLPADVFDGVVAADKGGTDRSVGNEAELLVREVLDAGLFDLSVLSVTRAKRATQFKGIDYTLEPCWPLTLEVKADCPGGVNGTGNLFVQTHEQNHHIHGRRAHQLVVG